MTRSQKRLLAVVAALPLLLVVMAGIYMVGMARLEGSSRTFWQSLEWAAETLSTTGYGADSRWSSPLMVIYTVIVQFVGVFLVFLIIPIYLVPFLEERFEERLPRSAPKEMREHVVVYRYGPAVETLLDRLSASDVAAIVVENDERAARALLDRGVPVIFVRGDADPLQACNLAEARALVANGRDEENGALILRARQSHFERDIYALVEAPVHRKPMELAGATAAYTPRHILAAALAAHASEQIIPRVAGLELAPGFGSRKIRVRRGGRLAGKTLRASALEAERGLTVAGQWIGGKLETRCTADMLVNPGAVLVVIGPDDALSRLDEASDDISVLADEGFYVIGGFGEVGRKIHELLTDAGEEVVVIDRQSAAGVDIAGNVLDPSVLERAEVARARSVILALDSDDATLFATVIVRDSVPDVPVIARVNHARNVENIYRAGADFALSISEISGQMLSSRLLHGAKRSAEPHLRIRRFAAEGLDGVGVGELDVRRRGACSVIAVQRGPELLPAFDGSLPIARGDALLVCGSDESLANVASCLVPRSGAVAHREG